MARFRSSVKTDVGLRRQQNEDSYLVNADLGLYVVCDGMGGHAGGETASRLAVASVERELLAARLREDSPFAAPAPLEDSPLAAALRQSIEAACAAVFHKSREISELSGMGTTCIALLLHEHQAIVGHVGDSRAYFVRDGQAHQLTEDHSLVNEQVRAGLLTPEEAKRSRLKNVITRSVGFEEEVLVDVAGLTTRPRDLFLLCSDGLSNLVPIEDIRDALLQHPIEEVAGRLVDLANERGGDDNSTVIAVERVE
jgi:serine/threonine protein phosphatase PrpC